MSASIQKMLLIAIILPLTACFPPPFYPGTGYYHGGYRANQPGYYNNTPYYESDRHRHGGYHDGWQGHHHGHH